MTSDNLANIPLDAIRRYFKQAVQHAILVLGKAEVRRIVEES